MRLLDRLEKKLGKYSIHNLSFIIILGQVVVFFANMFGMISLEFLSLSYEKILTGQVWRVITFIFIPMNLSPIWIIFAWYLFYLMGSSLEHYWGTFHFNIYILIGVIFANIVAFLTRIPIGANMYIKTSVFLAFAFLYPNYPLRLFFVISVKVKWLALITWAMYAWIVLTGHLMLKLLVLASVTNFLLFFTKDIIYKIKHRHRVIKHHSEKKIAKSKPLHTCYKCGITDKDDPFMDFRYCSECQPVQCFCEDHINDHEH